MKRLVLYIKLSERMLTLMLRARSRDDAIEMYNRLATKIDMAMLRHFKAVRATHLHDMGITTDDQKNIFWASYNKIEKLASQNPHVGLVERFHHLIN